MTQIKLNINELLALESEIAGVAVSNQVLLKGLLQQDLSYVHKFRLEDIVCQIKPQRERLEKLREELLKEYGEEIDGQQVIKEFLDEDDAEKQKANPDFLKANEEMKNFLEMEVTIDVYSFTESDFNFMGSEYYPVFNKLIRQIKERTTATV